jgi:outer membrane protein assembly factor BamB
MQSTYTNRDDGTLLLPNGSSVPVGETAGWLMIDDGSVPGLVFTVDSSESGVVGLNARDASTGRRVWHRADPVTSAILLDGVLYLATEQAVEAVDATTGRTRWSSSVTFQPEQVSTDGRYLLVPGPGVTLRAYTLSDGRLAWNKDLEAEVAGDRSAVYIQGFQASWHDPRLYVWMDDGAVAVLG